MWRFAPSDGHELAAPHRHVEQRSPDAEQLERCADPVGDLHASEDAWIDVTCIDYAWEVPAPGILDCALLAVGMMKNRHQHSAARLSRLTITPNLRFPARCFPMKSQDDQSMSPKAMR